MTIPGGGRYALALVVDALGAGLLRPFLLLYAIGVLGMPVGPAGAALSVGLLVGLGTLPLLGRWLAAVTAVAYLAAAVLVLTMRLRAHPPSVRRGPGADPPADPPGAGPTRRLTLLGVANLPYALCFAVLEVALPALVVTRLHAS